MDNDNEYSIPWHGYFFRFFVFTSLVTLLGLHGYGYFMTSNNDSLDGDFSDIKNVVVQLTRGLSEVTNKHEQLRSEMERIVKAIPRIQSSARAHDSLQGSYTRVMAVDVDYDRKITDFALETAGARILDIGDTVSHVFHESSVGFALYSLVRSLCRGGHECLNARAMIRPGSHPGECWAFKGQVGQATIRLLGTVHVTGVTLEHIPAHISPTKEISSAPRIFKLEGLEYRGEPQPHEFGTFEYNRDGRPIQYFEMQNLSRKPFSIVRVQFLSNWGNPVYTCVYRVRVHGELATAAAAEREREPAAARAQALAQSAGDDANVDTE